MLYIIGLGLNKKGLSREGAEAISRCKRIYLENYTVDFPYTLHQLEEMILKKILPADREKVEDLSIIDEATKMDVALLVYGSPLSATTHITLIEEAKAVGIKHKIIHNASIFDAVAETGLQLYKFGKVASLPAWKKSFKPDSFMEIVKENQSIDAHSLILIDIGLDFRDALNQLKISAQKHKIELDKLVLCQAMGTKNQKILYRELWEMEDFTGVRKPYCMILPSKQLHHLEADALADFSGMKQ
jgi:diphthine synthase